MGRYPSWTRDEACGSRGAFLRSSEAILVRGPPNRGPGSAVFDASGEPMTNGLSKKGKRQGWSAKDTRTLKSLAQKKTPARQIARELGRTEGAVRQKAMAVGTSLAHPAAEGLRSRLQLNEELIALSPTEMLFMPLVEDLPRKEGGGWSPEVHAVLAAEAKRLVGMARHAPDEAAGAVLLEPEIPGEVSSSASDVSTKVVRLVPPSGGIPGGYYLT